MVVEAQTAVAWTVLGAVALVETLPLVLVGDQVPVEVMIALGAQAAPVR